MTAPTPPLLVFLTDKQFELFQYPPTFYIRLFAEVLPKLPILPEVERQNIMLDKNARKLAREIKLFLESRAVPVSLVEIFGFIESSAADETLMPTFFKAIHARHFVIINGDQPNELFLELS